jgi:hypothetical protein
MARYGVACDAGVIFIFDDTIHSLRAFQFTRFLSRGDGDRRSRGDGDFFALPGDVDHYVPKFTCHGLLPLFNFSLRPIGQNAVPIVSAGCRIPGRQLLPCASFACGPQIVVDDLLRKGVRAIAISQAPPSCTRLEERPIGQIAMGLVKAIGA